MKKIVSKLAITVGAFMLSFMALIPNGVNAQGMAGVGAEEQAYSVYCQVLTDRRGCKDHSWRTCSSSVFCK